MPIKWTDWASLGNPAGRELGQPFVQRNQDGRLEVFAVSRGEMFNISQVAPNGEWRAEWRSKGRPTTQVGIQSHVVGRNADGRQEMFAIGEDGAVWQKWQVAPNNGWVDAWQSLGAPTLEQFPFADRVLNQLTAGRNQDGRQELFAVWSFNGVFAQVFQNWQTAPNGGWSGWSAMASLARGTALRVADRISVGRNADGRQELFAIAEEFPVSKGGALWHIWQVFPNGGWSQWEDLGQPRDPFPEPKDREISQPVVQRNADGHLEVFAPGNGAFCNRWQEFPLSIPLIRWRQEGWNAKPRPTPEVGLTCLETALNVSGPLNNHVEVFGLGDDGALWHAWQIDRDPFWSAWESLTHPPVKVRETDQLTVGTNQDGRIEVFLSGRDGAIWRTSQIR